MASNRRQFMLNGGRKPPLNSFEMSSFTAKRPIRGGNEDFALTSTFYGGTTVRAAPISNGLTTANDLVTRRENGVQMFRTRVVYADAKDAIGIKAQEASV